MKRKTAYRDEPTGSLKEIFDFLPPPHELFLKKESVKITLFVDSETLKFFKSIAKTSGKKYQKMMGEVLNSYAFRYKKSS